MFGRDSSKLVFAEKSHIDSATHLNGGQILSSVPNSQTSLVIGEGSKTHYAMKYSDTREIKTVKQFSVKKSGCVEDHAFGKKRIDLPASDPIKGGSFKTFDRRHLVQGPSEQSDKITVDWTSRNIPKTENGQNRNQYRSEEFHLSDVLTRKKSVETEGKRRNNIPTSVPGDKSYRKPEHSTGFYAEPGLVPGSTIVTRASGKPVLQKREETTTVQRTLSKMTYEEKVARAEEEYERSQVLLLNVSTIHKC
jgi:hypothetical protein